MYDKIIVPTDGSDIAMKGVKEGLNLAKSLNKPATAVHVIEIGDIKMSENMEKTLRKGAEATLEDVEKVAGELGVKLEKKIFKGSPYRKITEYAGKDDIIYISSHGRSGFRELFMGSTTERVVKKANCTVAIVKGGF
ncbi:MAG: universal stress protein [Candidatus Saliniplasma sp.]